MNTFKLISILCNAASAITNNLDDIADDAADRTKVTLTNSRWLSLSYSLDALRDLFEELPKEIKEQNQDVCGLVDNLHINILRDADMSGTQINPRKMSETMHLIHGFVYAQERIARMYR